MKTSLLVSLLCASFVALDAVAAPGTNAESKMYRGEVTTISDTAHTISVKQGKQTETFRVDAGTKLSTEAKPSAKLKDFRMGEKVTVEYKDEKDGRTAVSVCDTAANHSK